MVLCMVGDGLVSDGLMVGVGDSDVLYDVSGWCMAWRRRLCIDQSDTSTHNHPATVTLD